MHVNLTRQAIEESRQSLRESTKRQEAIDAMMREGGLLPSATGNRHQRRKLAALERRLR